MDPQVPARRRGVWTDDEHNLLEEAIRENPQATNAEIAQRVRTRTPEQVRTHMQKLAMKLQRHRATEHVRQRARGHQLSRQLAAYLETQQERNAAEVLETDELTEWVQHLDGEQEPDDERHAMDSESVRDLLLDLVIKDMITVDEYANWQALLFGTFDYYHLG